MFAVPKVLHRGGGDKTTQMFFPSELIPPAFIGFSLSKEPFVFYTLLHKGGFLDPLLS